MHRRVLKALLFYDPLAAFALQSDLVGPLAETIQTCNRDLNGIVAPTQAELTAAVGTQCETHNRNVQTAVESLTKSAPAGFEAAIAAMKSTISSADTLLETLLTSVQQEVNLSGSGI